MMDRQFQLPEFGKCTDSRPFLKWTGGKRWLLPELDSILPRRFKNYIEPFLGGGALFFHLRPRPALLSDINGELINAFRQVRDNVEDVIKRLSQFHICRDTYRQIRSKRARSAIGRAVKFLYLNRTAFNGIYRVNRRGEFNVPFGCKPSTVICEANLLRNASRSLQNRRLCAADFEEVMDQSGPGDLIYADPPYTTKHNNNGFRRYNEVIFSWKDQERLAQCCSRAVKRGVHILISNADHNPLIELYGGFCVKRVLRQSSISGSTKGRCQVTECLIYCVHDS